jgi:hypothetical protein
MVIIFSYMNMKRTVTFYKSTNSISFNLLLSGLYSFLFKIFILENCNFIFLDNPKFIIDLRDTIWFIPLGVKCFLLFNKLIISNHNSKSINLTLCKGYFKKWGTIKLLISLIESTL